MAFYIVQFDDSKTSAWDDFVLNKSMNGTFLQTRKFINYHQEGKFDDCSLMIFKGNDLVAVVLACSCVIDGEKYFFSHRGTTFGGLIVSRNVYSATDISEIMDLLDEKIKGCGFDKCYMKLTPQIFQRENADLIDYFFYQKGYREYTELNFYMNLDRYRSDVASQFSASKRRDFRYSMKNNLSFKELQSDVEIREFYEVLQLNLQKLNLRSVHSYEDLLELKNNRFNDEIHFYGVFFEDEMIAGSMIFIFDHKVFHTQYLSSNQKYLKLYPMDFLIYNLIRVAIDKEMESFTFGICTEDQGRYINLGLSRFKEGFGTEYCLNKSYEKDYRILEEKGL